MAEEPFQIAVAESEIEFLRQKLALTRFPDELEDVDRTYGTPLSDVKRLVEHWKNGYDWRKHEQALNDELPQFTRDIDVGDHGILNIHYVHKRSKVANAIPLIFIHGWPGSILEVRKVLPLLVEAPDSQPSFHVVAFSLPGFGFSEAPKKKGFDAAKFAEVGHKLMLALGYDGYVAQGGDWGSLIGRYMAETYGIKHCKAYHSNTPPFNSNVSAEDAGRARAEVVPFEDNAYFIYHSSKPQTLGYSLADSPSGLLGWIYEKLVSWSDAYPWTDDEVLTWVSLYWFSGSGPAASIRIYKEVYLQPPFKFPNGTQITVPRGYSYFPGEPFAFPRALISVPLTVFEKEHTRGGHFAAYEVPELLAGDLREMFGKTGPAFGVVDGKTGYST